MGKVCDMRSLEDLGAVLRGLGGMARGKTMLDALTAGARVLKENTKQQLVSKVEGATRPGLKGRPKYATHEPMIEGVRVLRDAAYTTAAVSIMGDFRLKWFEKGTRERWAGGRMKKDGSFPGWHNASNYRGRIDATRFFAQARNNEAPIEDAIMKSLDKSVNKILRK